MNFAENFKTLSHAYVIAGNRSLIEPELLTILEKKHKVCIKGNSDFWVGSFKTFTIDDARHVKNLASNRKSGEGKRVFVLSVESLTREASNALLKTLEEPGEDNHFFIIIPSAKRILPTISSRVVTVIHEGSSQSSIISPEKFISLSPAERMKVVKEIMVKLDKEEITKSDVISLIEDIVRDSKENGKISNKISNLGRKAEIASYGLDQSASLKMILEYLALV